MKHLASCIALILVLAAAPTQQSQAQISKERAEELANSPAKRRLDEIQQYKPTIRRSRSIAIQELEKDIATAYFKIEAAEKVLYKQRRLQKKNHADAWSPEQMAAAEQSLENLEAFVEAAEEHLGMAKAEHERVLALLARERSEHEAEEEDEEYEEDDDDGNSSLSIPAGNGLKADGEPPKQQAPKGDRRKRTPVEEDVDDEDRNEEDN